MSAGKKLGVFFCGEKFKVKESEISELLAYTRKLPTVVFAKELWGDSLPSDYLASELESFLKNQNIDGIIVVSESPGYFKGLFLKTLSRLGLGKVNVALAPVRTFIDGPIHTLERLKAIVACSVFGVPNEKAFTAADNSVNDATLVIGGGIAGIQASLEIARAGYKVYLVEKSPTIGGKMAMFDKTFPTLDCAACILTPKMVEVGQHPKIELLTYSEIIGISGTAGNFTARILKKAKYVDMGKCIGCGICAEKCPGKTLSEFDSGVTQRTAIYIPFPQAVPNKYIIDRDSCTYLLNGKCGACVKKCPTGAINFDDKDTVIEVKVGNVIIATGFKPFDPKRIERFGYGVYPNVVTSLEFERLLNASGPTDGHIKLKSQDKKGNWVFKLDGVEPKSIAIIHCVGSRDENYNKYCSRVCCMYSLKFAHLAKEKLPDAEIYEYYIDMRAFGKGYEEFYERIKSEGVHLIRGRSGKVFERNGKLVVRSEDILSGKLMEQETDMVVLSVGLEPDEDSKKLATMLGLKISESGWFSEFDYKGDPIATSRGGVFIAGVCQGPKDIPDTVAQASAVAARVIQSIMRGKVKDDIRHLPLEKLESQFGARV